MEQQCFVLAVNLEGLGVVKGLGIAHVGDIIAIGSSSDGTLVTLVIMVATTPMQRHTKSDKGHYGKKGHQFDGSTYLTAAASSDFQIAGALTVEIVASM